MKRTIFNAVLVPLTLCLILISNAYGQGSEDIEEIVAETAIEGAPSAMSGYTYKLEFTRVKRSIIGRSTLRRRYRALLPTNVPRSHSFRHPLLLVYDNTRKLLPSQIVNERNRIVERLDEIESEEPSEEEIGRHTDGYMTLRADSNTVGDQALKIDLFRLLKTVQFSNLKQLTVGGRPGYSLEFYPNPEEKYTSDLFYLGKIEGIILIDEDDKRIVSVEAFPIGGLAKFNAKPEEERNKARVFYYQQIRMSDGHWFPKVAELNFMEFPYEFNRLAVKVRFSFSEYNKFSTGIESHDIEEILETESDEPSTDTKN